MTDKIQRFDVYSSCGDHITIEEHPEGEWIRFNDVDALYQRIENWQRHFYKMATEGRGADDYYTSAASGLGIALQEINKEHFDKTSGVIWSEYLESWKAAAAKIEPKKRYVAGFLIDRWSREVVLVKKNRPKWQEGRYNGVGGHIEERERPEDAMQREFHEETGHDRNDWELYTTLEGNDFIVHFFRAFDFDLRMLNISTVTDEPIEILSIDEVSPANCIPNLTWLIPMALSSANTCTVQEYK